MPGSAPTAKRTVPPRTFAAPHVFVLATVEGGDPSAVFRIARTDTRIGRDAAVEVTLDDDEVSKHHCTVRYDAGRCHLIDAGSLNGTLINERPLAAGVAHRLRHLDEITIGGTRLVFLTGRFSERGA